MKNAAKERGLKGQKLKKSDIMGLCATVQAVYCTIAPPVFSSKACIAPLLLPIKKIVFP